MTFAATEATNLDECRRFSEVAALSQPTMQVSVLTVDSLAARCRVLRWVFGAESGRPVAKVAKMLDAKRVAA
jgi:hypothetical protein